MEDLELAIFTVVLLNAMRRGLGDEGLGGQLTKVVLILAFGDSGTAERDRNRLLRSRHGEMSGHDLAREPRLREQRDFSLNEMPLLVYLNFSAQLLLEAKRSDDGPGLHTRWIRQQQLLHLRRSR